jgi:type VI secretion system protein VasD
MKNRRRLFFLLFPCAVLLILTGCPKEPARVNVVLSAAQNINPDPSGQPLSVVVRIYQLKDPGRLETADYNAIWKSDKQTLSDDFLDRQERIVQPGVRETLEIRTSPLTAYLGVVALFRNPSGDTWRKIIPVHGKNPKIVLNIREQSIEISSVDQ